MHGERTCILALSILLLLSMTSMTSCKALTSESSPDDLQKRVAEYWGFKVSGQFEKAYLYELPSTVENVSIATYSSSLGPGAQWLGAELEKVSIDGTQAKVVVKIRYRLTFTEHQPPEGMVSRRTEEWQLHDGKWHHVYIGPRDVDEQKNMQQSGKKTDGKNLPTQPNVEQPQETELKTGGQTERGDPKTGDTPKKLEKAPAVQSGRDTDKQ